MDQFDWLTRGLAASQATWKVIARDVPIGLVIRNETDAFEAVANGDGPPLEREAELADLLSNLKRERVRDIIWLTAAVHDAAAPHSEPERAKFVDFDPFWEFVAGPPNAGTFGPNELDEMLGPREVFRSISDGLTPIRPPSEGFQFFGRVRIDGRTGILTASLYNIGGRRLYADELPPER